MAHPGKDPKARSLTQLHDRVADGFVIAEFNSALYVARASPDAARGHVDREAIAMRRRTGSCASSAAAAWGS
jgi:hypothetical protein